MSKADKKSKAETKEEIAEENSLKFDFKKWVLNRDSAHGENSLHYFIRTGLERARSTNHTHRK